MIDQELMEADNCISKAIDRDRHEICSQFMYSTCSNSGTNISPTMRDQSFQTMILLHIHIHACAMGWRQLELLTTPNDIPHN